MKDKYNDKIIIQAEDWFDNTKTKARTENIYCLEIEESRRKAPRLSQLLDKVFVPKKGDDENGKLN